MKLNKNLLIGAALGAAVMVSGHGIAQATEGYFTNGIGARHKALAGAGAADSRDVTATTNNPAGLVHAPDEATISASLFSPDRGYKGTNNTGLPAFTLSGEQDSKSNYFVIPNFAISKGIQGIPLFDVIGFSVSGNGGMNTDYENVARPGAPGPGVFFSGKTGINLEQMLISVTAAKQFNGFSVGVAPIVARQVIHVQGLNQFAGLSQHPNTVSGNGTAESWGFGVRGGLEAELMPNVRLGITGTSPIWMSEFSEYSGLFAENGDFDIPPSLQVGLAVDVMPNLTIMADYKRIWYSYTNSVNNPSTNVSNCTAAVQNVSAANGPGCLGNTAGAGFGWEDINVYKVAAELRDVAPGLTLRAGYAYSENPVQSRDVMFNIIAPGIVKHHITGGAMLKISENLDFEVAGLYVPEETLSGFELGIPNANPGHAIELRMSQWELTAGIVYHFGQPEDILK